MTEIQSPETVERRARIVFFDAGNTLLHVHPSIGEVYSEVSREFGCDVPPEDLERHLLGVWGDYLRQQGQTAETLQTSEEREFEMWRTLTYALYERLPALDCEPRPWFEALHGTFGEPQRFRLFPDVLETFRTLKDMGIQIGVISNWDRRLESILAGVGLGEILDVVVISSLVGYSKPHPRIFEIALETAGLHREEAVHVGDTIRDDVEGARRAGIDAVLVRRPESLGIRTRNLLPQPPAPDCSLVTSLTELPALLSN